MKKFILAVAAVMAIGATPAFAEEEYGMQKGDFSTEIMFNPFSDDFGTFKLDQLKLRYMFSDKDAVRFGIGFGLDNNKTTPDPEDDENSWVKQTSGNFSINLGYERHLIQKGRLDIYVGAGLGYERINAGSTIHTEYDNEEYEYKMHNAWGTFDGNDFGVDNSHRTANIFRVDIFTGIDFYVYKGLYVGAELGIRFKTACKPGYYTSGPGYDDNGNFVKDLESKKADKQTEVSFKTYCEPALRLGWTF